MLDTLQGNRIVGFDGQCGLVNGVRIIIDRRQVTFGPEMSIGLQELLCQVLMSPLVLLGLKPNSCWSISKSVLGSFLRTNLKPLFNGSSPQQMVLRIESFGKIKVPWFDV
jgi:hypothetical protein